MKKRGRRISTRNIIAGLVALLTFSAVVAAPFWLIKVGQAVKSHHAKTSFAAANHVGQVVHDGTMSFVVNSVRCGVTKIAKEEPTHGQFCVFKLTVGNESASPVAFNAISQRAMGSKGGFYIPDPAADAVSNKASDTVPDVGLFNQQGEASLKPTVAPAMKPGTSHQIQIVYDIPTTVRLTQIDLHAAEYTVGVVVLL